MYMVLFADLKSDCLTLTKELKDIIMNKLHCMVILLGENNENY